MCSIGSHTLNRLGVGTLTRIREIDPGMLTKPEAQLQQSLPTGNPQFDALFPTNGIPFGQLFELTGDPSGGKTSLVLHLLAHAPATIPAAYVDTASTFFPCAAAASGVATQRLRIVRTSTGSEAVSAAEHLLCSHLCRLIVCDLTECRDALRTEQIHRLRVNTIRKHGLVIILTNSTSGILPPSTMSAQLTARRSSETAIAVTVTKSRLMRVGTCATIDLL